MHAEHLHFSYQLPPNFSIKDLSVMQGSQHLLKYLVCCLAVMLTKQLQLACTEKYLKRIRANLSKYIQYEQ